MPRPDTADDVFDLVRRSRAVEEARLGEFLAGLPPTPEGGLEPPALLGLMVEAGLLTPYQAEELAAGRWWGFWVGGYRVIDRLGRGGMGQVFLAEHGLLGKRVALKVLSASLRADPTARDRFVREARAAAALDHPNIVRIFDANIDHDPPFLVMEYVPGVSLQAAVVRHGAFAAADAAAVGVQVARGLQHAHEQGLVHRDIKPANVILEPTGSAKVLDLGIARFAGDPASGMVDVAVVLGTLDYLAPEQALDSSAVDTRADIYALGATLYFLLTGHPPFPGDDVDEKLALKQNSDPPPLDQFRPDVPPGFADAVRRMLARNPAERFATPAAAAAALGHWARPGPDFPDRYLRPPTASIRSADLAGRITDPGRDSEPTSLTATRRITRARPAAVAVPELPPPPTAEPTPPGPEPLAVQAEDGSPTCRLGGPAAFPTPGWHRSRNWLVWLALGLVLLAALCCGGSRLLGSPPPPPEHSSCGPNRP